ncbi:MAG: hypothetical protein CMB80_01995 [Flammeovirgaceae bacterium]|jgi:hypothetical protein|nr:hypothetical protein [Flammeovirgaceae bacterium]|tara:strand:- start:122 stop:991 length:870 start_codon:yes stop_codon:yes gene_type:complete
MRHNKIRNPGIILELLNKRISSCIASGNIKEGKSLYNLMRKYFLSKSGYIREVYDRIYSPILYGETRNHYYASNFLGYIMEEYVNIDEEDLNREINKLIADIDKITNRKKLFDEKIDNYKLHASIKCLGDHLKKDIGLTPKDRLQCERIIMEHLNDNQEIKKLNESHKILKTTKTKDEIAEQHLTVAIAMKKFKENYKHTLNDDQNEFLIKYLTSPSNKSFCRWAEKKLDKVISEIKEKKEAIEDDKLQEKLELTQKKLEVINRDSILESDNMVNLLLSFELINTLKLW